MVQQDRHLALLGVRLLLSGLVGLAAGVAGATPFAYITNAASNTVSVIDVASEALVATIPVPATPTGVAVNPTGAFAYVASQNGSAVSVIAVVSQTVVTTIPVPGWPNSLAVNPADTRLYVADPFLNRVSVVDLDSRTVIATIPVGTTPWGIVTSPDGDAVYVANRFTDNSVSVIDASTNSVVATIAGFFFPQSIAISRGGDRLWVGNLGNGTISVVDTATRTIVNTIQAANPAFLTLSPDGSRLYVTSFATNATPNLLVFDAGSLAMVATLTVGNFPVGVDVDPAGRRIYVANNTSGTVSIVDATTHATVATVPVGISPYAYGVFIGGAVHAGVVHQTPTLNEFVLVLMAISVGALGALTLRARNL